MNKDNVKKHCLDIYEKNIKTKFKLLRYDLNGPLLEHLKTEYGPNLKLSEYLYQGIHDKDISCPNGKNLKFKNIYDGYGFCGISCQCKKEHQAKVISEKWITVSDEEKHKRNEKLKETNIKKYGVENPMQLDSTKEKIKQTNIEKYGVGHYSQTSEYKEKIKNTTAENVKKSSEVIGDIDTIESMKDYVIGVWNTKKEKAYNILKRNNELCDLLSSMYGDTLDFTTKVQLYINNMNGLPICKYSGCNNSIPYKRGKFSICCSRNCHNKYLKENGLFEEINTKRKNSMIEKYGVEHQMHLQDIKEKIKQTNIEKYGVDYYLQSPDYIKKSKQTNIKKYGVEYHTQSEKTKLKIKQTNIEKYGCFYTQTDEFKNKSKQTNIEKYCVEHPMFSPYIKDKIKQTNIEKYGVNYFSQSDIFKEKYITTNLEKYGVDNYKKIHYSSEYIEIFNDIEKFTELLYQHGTYKLAELINCNVTTIYEFSIKNNISLPPRTSSCQEEIIQNFLTENNIPFISNTRRIIPSGKELDFYFPEHNLAIELNGLYWHSELSGGKDRKYHYNKWKECNDLGITLLSIQEDEFKDKPQFWFNKILYMTGNMKPTKVHARKCEIRELVNVTNFLNDHHVQGSCASSYKFGLFYNGELVSVMTFSNTRNNDSGIVELSRFCNHSGYLVSGGASKLLAYFIKNYRDNYEKIISFSDNNYSNGNVYSTLGFELTKNLKSDYKYISPNYTSRQHKAGFRKSSIFKKFDIPDDMKNKSEWELMQYLGYDRIWDTGKKKWEMKI